MNSEHEPLNDFRFERISNSRHFLQLISTATKVNVQDAKKSIVREDPVKTQAPELVSVGGVYFVTSNWDLFSKHYFNHFIPTGEVVAQYLGLRVEVLEVEGDVVRVSFENDDLEDGWLPWQVLKSSKARSTSLKLAKIDLKVPDPPPTEDLGEKIEALQLKNSQLEHQVLESSRMYQDVRVENLELKTKIANLHDKHTEEKEQLQRELTQKRNSLYQQIKRAKELERTHVPKQIKYLPSLLDSANLTELFQALREVQSQIEERTRQMELEKARAEDRQLCRVCLTEAKTHIFQPCNHFCVCHACAVKCKESSHHRCPICRTPIATIERVFTT